MLLNRRKTVKNVEPEDFEFVGYELLDKEYGTSALTTSAV
jgi:hypothetical protein